MILHIDIHGHVALHEATDFRRLHCEFALSPGQRDLTAALLQDIAHLEGDDAWIDVRWMRSQAPRGDAAWLCGFEQMLAQARPYDCVSADGLRVKAHVIWTAPDLAAPPAPLSKDTT